MKKAKKLLMKINQKSFYSLKTENSQFFATRYN